MASTILPQVLWARAVSSNPLEILLPKRASIAQSEAVKMIKGAGSLMETRYPTEQKDCLERSSRG